MDQDQRISGYAYVFDFQRVSEFEMQASRFLLFLLIDIICKRVEWGPTSQTGPRVQASVRCSNERKNARRRQKREGIAVYWWAS